MMRKMTYEEVDEEFERLYDSLNENISGEKVEAIMKAEKKYREAGFGEVIDDIGTSYFSPSMVSFALSDLYARAVNDGEASCWKEIFILDSFCRTKGRYMEDIANEQRDCYIGS